MKRSAYVAALVALAGLTVLPVGAQSGQRREFKPVKVLNRFLPTIRNPKTLPASEAGRVVTDNELVLGVVIGKQARAYPINQLTGPSREIINDTLGGQAIAATW